MGKIFYRAFIIFVITLMVGVGYFLIIPQTVSGSDLMVSYTSISNKNNLLTASTDLRSYITMGGYQGDALIMAGPFEEDNSLITFTSDWGQERGVTSDGLDLGYHNGFDFTGDSADINVVSFVDGTVVDLDDTNCVNGCFIKIRSEAEPTLVFEYWHFDVGSIPDHLQKDSIVSAGEVIGNVGSTGKVTGPHLHVLAKTGNNLLAQQMNAVHYVYNGTKYDTYTVDLLDYNNFVWDANYKPDTLNIWYDNLRPERNGSIYFVYTDGTTLGGNKE